MNFHFDTGMSLFKEPGDSLGGLKSGSGIPDDLALAPRLSEPSILG
jgi:hypothetical protein